MHDNICRIPQVITLHCSSSNLTFVENDNGIKDNFDSTYDKYANKVIT